jgi:hypothetical protein
MKYGQDATYLIATLCVMLRNGPASGCVASPLWQSRYGSPINLVALCVVQTGLYCV